MRSKTAGLLAIACLAAAPASAQTGAGILSAWQPDLSSYSEFLGKLSSQEIVPATAFGAKPDDRLDDSAAIAEALRLAAARPGGAVLLAAGTYQLDRPVGLVSNVALIGQGCGNTKLVRSPRFRGQILLEAAGVSNVRVQGISFDHNSGPEYTTSIALRRAGSNDVVILDNCFTDSRPVPGGGDRWAISLGSGGPRRSLRVWIGRNNVSGGMQLTANGGQGVSILRIVDNAVRDGRNAGVAVTTLDPRGQFDDVLIGRNRIINSRGLGIYVGPDQEQASASTFRNLVIADNIVRGFSGPFPIGIYVRAAGQADGITVSNNQLDGQGRTESTGIRFTDKFWGLRKRATNVRIEGNSVLQFERGIWLSSVDRARVSGNIIRTLNGTRPYMIDPAENTNVAVAR